jgi:phenylacetate-CoA ligase
MMKMKNKDDRPYWNMEIEPKLNTPEMREIQEHKLKRRIKLLRERAPYYTQLFKACGVHEDKIKSFEEFRRAVPPFTKKDWHALAEKHEGNLLEAINEITVVNAYEDLNLMCTTTGTTGEPQPYPMSKRDLWDIYGEVLARYNWRCGVRGTDRMLLGFGLSMAIAGVPSLVGCWKIGALALPVGAEAGTERILRTARYFRPTVLTSTPSLAAYLIEKAPEVIGMKVGELGIRIVQCGGEPGAGIPEVRQKIESAYGARLFDLGGALGVSCAHEEYQGMHQVGDDFMIVELVDPDTKEPLPFENGQRGEALFTQIDGDGWLGARIAPGDIMEIYTEPCPCGLSGFRYKIVGRTDDMLKVKGVMVYPTMIRSVIESFVPRVTGQMRIVLDEPPPRVVPPLKLKVERGEEFPSERLGELTEEISDMMSSKIKIRPKIIWLEPKELERSTYKGKTFEKTYEKK